MSKKQYIGQSLSEYNPELTKELHPTKNGGLLYKKRLHTIAVYQDEIEFINWFHLSKYWIERKK
jgi:hypothetical protein